MQSVPQGLRNALIDAMGGNGPFVVREICSIFDAHDLTATVQADEGGERRTAAAERIDAVDWSNYQQREALGEVARYVISHDAGADGAPGRMETRLLASALGRAQSAVPTTTATVEASSVADVRRTWNALAGLFRTALSFSDIKETAGRAGLPVERLAHLRQATGGSFNGVSKAQLLEGVASVLPDDATAMRRCVEVFVRARIRSPRFAEELDATLAAVGWRWANDGLALIDAPAVHDIAERAGADWSAVESRLAETASALTSATTLDDYQDVGRRCREVVADAAAVVFDEAHVPTGEEVPGPRDAKRILGNFMAANAPHIREESRRLVRAALDVMNATTHRSSAAEIDAAVSAQAAVLIVRTVQAVERAGRSARAVVSAQGSVERIQ